MTAAPVDRADPAFPCERSPIRRALGVGLVLGAVAVYCVIVGILPLMDARWVVVNVVTLGKAVLIAIGLSAGVAVARRTSSPFSALAPASLLAGGAAGALLGLLALGMQILPLRQIFISLSPAVLKSLTFGLGRPSAARSSSWRARCSRSWAPR